MKAKSHFLILIIFMFLQTGIFCQENYILYICDATNDSEFTEILENAGYNVIRIVEEYKGILSQEQLDYANNADLIIIARNAFSVDYGSTEELASQWNSIETPILCLSVFMIRDYRWQWFSSRNVFCEGEFSIRVPASARNHSIFEGIGTTGTFDIYTGVGADLIYETPPGNARVLAYNSDESGIYIAEWSAGIPFYEGTEQIPSAKRVFFAAGESDCGPSGDQNMSAYNLNQTGKILFLNTVNYLMPDAILQKFPYGNTPVIDGTMDPLWYDVDLNYIELTDEIFSSAGPPTLDLATWRGAWNDTAIFVLITVEEDDFFPHYEAGSELNWEYDKPEIYIDVNVGELNDGLGPISTNTGHYQFSPEFVEGSNPHFSSGITWFGCYLASAYKVEDPDYVYEYAFNISDLHDKYGSTLDPAAEPLVGFEVCIIDRDAGDAGRRFAVWKNTGENGYSWDNMDDCGEVAFSNEEISSNSTTFYKLQDGCAPVIDGTKDAIWEFAELNYINRHYRYENPSLDKATWQAVWNDTSIFIIVAVEDNSFSPSWISGDVDWMSDKVEIYFDVNNYLEERGGPESIPGHYHIAPDFHDNIYMDYACIPMYTGGHGQLVSVAYAYNVNAPDYIFEYAVNISDLRDTDGAPLNPYNIDMIGFDVCIIDRDAGENIRKRAVWRNTGAQNENWFNMDDCGRVKFSTNTMVEFPRPELRLKGENILICLDSGRNSYNWYYEDQLLTEEIKQFYRITSGYSGNYYVVTDNEYGCKIKSNPLNFNANSGTLNSSEPYIGIYPVPAQGDFMFEMADDNSGRIIINIRDFSGKIIKSILLEKDTEYISGKIDIHNISKGIYLMEIIFKNKAYFKRVLIN